MNERLTLRIKQQARQTAWDTYEKPTDLELLVIENAMLAGAALAIENDIKASAGGVEPLCDHSMEPAEHVLSNWCNNCHGYFKQPEAKKL